MSTPTCRTCETKFPGKDVCKLCGFDPNAEPTGEWKPEPKPVRMLDKVDLVSVGPVLNPPALLDNSFVFNRKQQKKLESLGVRARVWSPYGLQTSAGFSVGPGKTHAFVNRLPRCGPSERRV